MTGNTESSISAFAFNTGKSIEDLIYKQMDGLTERNQMLEAKILNFYVYLIGQSEYYGTHNDITNKFIEDFNIQTNTQGKI